MKCIKIDLPSEFKTIEIDPLYDLHIGAKKCDVLEIQRRIDYIKDHDNVFCILGGDIINNSTINSVASADVYDAPLSPQQQMEVAIRMLEPIKHKILGIVSGNHERRDAKDGIDLTQFMALQLGCVDKYDVASVVLFVRFGRQIHTEKFGGSAGRKTAYTIFATHGSGGGSTVGGKANKLSKYGTIVDADLVIIGHTHQPLTFRETSYKVNYQNSSVFPFEQVFINTSATLDYESYAELFGMKPSSKICPMAILDGSRKEIVVRA